MLSGSGHNTNPQDVVWFCHICRWSGVLLAGEPHRCGPPVLPDESPYGSDIDPGAGPLVRWPWWLRRRR